MCEGVGDRPRYQLAVAPADAAPALMHRPEVTLKLALAFDIKSAVEARGAVPIALSRLALGLVKAT